MKYDYKGASALYDEFRNQFTDPWDLSESEWQENRRDFMRAFTRRSDDRQQYIDYAQEWLNDCYPVQYGTSKCYDFELIRECERIIQAMIDF